MEFIFQIPASIKIAAAFAGILVLYRLRIPLAWSVLMNTALLTFLTGSGSSAWAHLAQILLLPQNYLMLFVIILLTFFSDALSTTGKMEKSVAAFRSVIKNQRLLAGGLPAIIGLLPMPGGALFSAPFLASADEKNALLPEQKSAINYWFRHIWEYWWPLYPGVILATQYSGLPFGLYLLIMAPFTLASVCGGWFFLLRAIPSAHPEDSRERGRRRDALRSLWPIGLLVAISVAASALLPRAGVSAGLANLYGMLGGLVVALAAVFGNNGRIFRTSCARFLTPATWTLVFIVASVLAFSAVLQIPVDGKNATLVSLMRDDFLRLGIPIVAIIVLVPFISGLVTGISVAFVGAGFPIVFALIGSHPPMSVLIAATSLAYVSGYIGLMLSPMHICYIMSNEYFKTGFSRTYRHLVGPSATVATFAIVLCSIYYFVFR